MSYRLEYTVRPIEIWPGKRTPEYGRKPSPLKGSWARTLEELSRELGMLGARNVTFRLDVRESHLRQDGQMRADARPKDPGVLLEFVAARLPGEPRLVYKCDRYKFWQDNLLHIALGLESLRRVDRYGITSASEQYAGFKALPSNTAPTLTTAEAAGILEAYSNVPALQIHREVASAKEAARTAVFRTHPDRNNGDRVQFDRVDLARKVLSSHHGVSL
jgi:hypothetical protein